MSKHFHIEKPPEDPEERRQWSKELAIRIQSEIEREVTKARTPKS